MHYLQQTFNFVELASSVTFGATSWWQDGWLSAFIENNCSIFCEYKKKYLYLCLE